MSDTIIRAHQLKLLDIMKLFHELCVRHRLTYYLLGGTMLGAVRHQGFIPWDDDIDVGMPRGDYEKLLALPQSEWAGHLHLKTPHNATDLILPYSKLMDRRTTLVEDYSDGLVGGVYIDVFPLDGAGNSMASARLIYRCYYWERTLLHMNQNKKPLKDNLFRRLLRAYARLYRPRSIYRRVERIMTFHSYEKSRYIGNFGGVWKFKEFMPKDYFGEPTLYAFEGSKFWGVEKADAYLTALYGDYMTLPPVDARQSHHNIKHMDLDSPYSDYPGCVESAGKGVDGEHERRSPGHAVKKEPA